MRQELRDIEDTTCADCVQAPHPMAQLCESFDCAVLGKKALLCELSGL